MPTPNKKIKVTEADISELTPLIQNPRKRTPLSRGVIERSLRTVGACRSIVVDENGVVRAGNGTLEEAGQIGIEKVIVIETTGHELVEVKRTGLTEEQWQQYTVADNTASDFSTWDAEILAEIAQEVDLDGFFPSDKLDEILNGLVAPEPNPEEDEDELKDLLDNVGKVESRVKPGDIFALGRHRICCADSTVERNVRALLGDRKIDLLITDPPYGVKVAGGTKDPRSKGYRSGKTIENDDITGDDLKDFLYQCFSVTNSVMRDGAVYYICYPDIFAYEFIGSVRDVGWKQARPPVVLWIKDSFVFGQGDYHSRSEPILYGWKPGAAHKAVEDRTQDNVWEIPRPRDTKDIHPSVKPVELFEKAIRNSSDSEWIIYDPFLGSGTTVIATQKAGNDRVAYGLELSEDYCETIIQRYEQFTGDVAKFVGRIPE